MRVVFSLVAGLALFVWAGFASAQSIEFRNVSARVVVIPEARDDVQVVILKTNPSLPLYLHKEIGGRTVVSGPTVFGFFFFSSQPDCDLDQSHPVTDVPRVGRIAFEDLPQIVVRVPQDATVEAGGAIYGSVGRAHSLQLRIAGCGEWTVANVEDDLKVESAGSDRLHTGSAGHMSLDIAGASTTTTTAVADGLSVEIAGAGDVRVGHASGKVRVDLAGGGNVRIDGGRASTLGVNIMGSGNVDYGGTADTLEASIAGSGDVRAAKVTGSVSRSIAGSGSVEVGP